MLILKNFIGIFPRFWKFLKKISDIFFKLLDFSTNDVLVRILVYIEEEVSLLSVFSITSISEPLYLFRKWAQLLAAWHFSFLYNIFSIKPFKLSLLGNNITNFVHPLLILPNLSHANSYRFFVAVLQSKFHYRVSFLMFAILLSHVMPLHLTDCWGYVQPLNK